MKILLLGSTGYLGGNIAKHMSSHGDELFCVVRKTSDISRLLTLNNIKLISSEPSQVELTMETEKIDWVINGVCTYSQNESLYGDMIESNVIYPLSVLNLTIKYGIKNYMTMGTGLPDDFNMYSFTKAKFSDFGKFLSKNDGINFADLKLEMFYGGWNEPEKRFLKSCKMKLERNEPLFLTEGFQKRDIVRVEDIVGIIGRIVHTDYVRGYQVLPVGCGEQHSIREIIQQMREYMNSLSDINYGTIPNRDGEPDTLADITWYKNINYKLQYSYFDGLKDICAR